MFKGRDEIRFIDGSTAQKVAPVTTGGSAVNPAREDGNLAALLAAADHVVCGAYRVAIDGTSRLLTALSGGPTTLPDNLVRLAIIPEAGTTANVNFALGADASGTTPQWPASGMNMPMTAALARTMKVIASVGTIYATLVILTPRN